MHTYLTAEIHSNHQTEFQERILEKLSSYVWVQIQNITNVRVNL